MSLLLNIGTLIDGTGEPAKYQQSVLITGDTLVRIGPQGSIPANGAQVIEAPNSTLIPGLFDLHSHMTLLLKPIGAPVDQSLRRDELVATRVFKAALGAKIWLQTGVTTIRHAGAGDNFAVAMKEAIAEGWTPGPRVFASGSLIAQTGGVRPGHERLVAEVTGADEARRVARQQLKAGVDVLKIYGASSIGGGGGRLIGPPGWPQLTVEEMCAVVEEAHKPGRLASAHTGSAESVKNAVRAGVDWVDHADMMDDEAIDMLLDTKTPVVPTMAIAWSLAEFGEEMGFGKHIASKAAEVAAEAKERLRRAYRAGVCLAVGTDADNPRATVAKECQLLTEIGMSPMEALVAATRIPAEILHTDDTLGTVEVGKIADLVIVSGNPLQDIGALSNVESVIQSGQPLQLPLVDLKEWGYE